MVLPFFNYLSLDPVCLLTSLMQSSGSPNPYQQGLMGKQDYQTTLNITDNETNVAQVIRNVKWDVIIQT